MFRVMHHSGTVGCLWRTGAKEWVGAEEVFWRAKWGFGVGMVFRIARIGSELLWVLVLCNLTRSMHSSLPEPRQRSQKLRETTLECALALGAGNVSACPDRWFGRC